MLRQGQTVKNRLLQKFEGNFFEQISDLNLAFFFLWTFAPTPPKFGGDISTLNLGCGPQKKDCKTRDSGHSSPKFWGWICHPPKFRGYGFMRDFSFEPTKKQQEKIHQKMDLTLTNCDSGNSWGMRASHHRRSINGTPKSATDPKKVLSNPQKEGVFQQPSP